MCSCCISHTSGQLELRQTVFSYKPILPPFQVAYEQGLDLVLRTYPPQPSKNNVGDVVASSEGSVLPDSLEGSLWI